MTRTTQAWYDADKGMVLVKSTNPMTDRSFFIVVPPREAVELMREMAEALRQASEAADQANYEASAAEMHTASARRAEAVQTATEIITGAEQG